VIDFSSFKMDDKKINYDQWYSARMQKMQKQIEVRNDYGEGDGNGNGNGRGGGGRVNGKGRAKGKGGGGGGFRGRGRWGKK
jgi:chromosome transmission fidelity protein 18